ncbi:MHYT domain-containing protein [Streptomyces massasporeus]|uniref:MHYT domain-containing protein n=1 Tax=Streptomyces massasporeus TaxID=67324 RepID=UPI0033E71C8C
MAGEIDGFTYGAVTPTAALLMAALGSSLGVRCLTRALHQRPAFRPGWLTLGAAAIGCGMWISHSVAMMGLSVGDAHLTYDEDRAFLGLGVTIAVVGVGLFVAGYFGRSPAGLGAAGVITGAGVAAGHIAGMTTVHTTGRLRPDLAMVVLSVVVAVAAATVALRVAVRSRTVRSHLVAGPVLAAAVTGAHYTAMHGLSYRPSGAAGDGHSHPSVPTLLPLLTAPVFVLLLTAFVLSLDPFVHGVETPRADPSPVPGQGTGTSPALRGSQL